MGYDFDKDKGLVINKAEAEIVKRIFSEYLGGKGTNAIAKGLNKDKIPTVTGIEWCGSGISRMLRNEKYMGDVLLQKTITADNITFSRKRNKGELPQYYIKNDHEPIISREDFKRARELSEKWKKEKGMDEDVIKRMSNRYPLSGKIICESCGKTFKRSILNSNNKYRSAAYRCNSNIYEQTGLCYASGVRARINIKKILSVSNSIIENDIEIAINKTINDGFSSEMDHSICHGIFGNIDILLLLGRQMERKSLIDIAYEEAEKAISDIRENGIKCGLKNGFDMSTFMLGLSGIGYVLLRLNNPDLPSVLSLDI